MEPPARSETPRPHSNGGTKRANSTTPKRTGRQRSLTEVLMNMEIMQHTTSVLFVGLEPTWVERNGISSIPDPEKTYATIKASFEKLQRTEGLYMELHAINPDSRDNINDLKRKIRDGTGPEGGSKAWDGVLLGYGLRSDLSLTKLFEELVNYIHETLPGAKLLFSSNDEDHGEAVRRNLNIGHERIPLTKSALEAMNSR
ncbi:hypothetical protein Slin15195_G034070 [Septoria linicola]|uniref:Uncharacterized protein n=1 Tax=Septoria linicola TaxID=215465 RepID=A0A9Q9EI88_9PEZI|nr:hypothetical protein Slin15195_G034070 [Septoria linicola]